MVFVIDWKAKISTSIYPALQHYHTSTNSIWFMTYIHNCYGR